MKIPLYVEVIGEPESGKTHFSLTAPNPFLIDTTPKFESLPILMKLYPDDYLARSRNVRTWKDIEEAVNFALEKKFMTIIFDTSADLQQLAAEQWLKETGKKAVYPITEYRWVRMKVDNLIWKIINSGINVILTSQMRDEWVGDKRTGRRERDGYKKAEFQADIRLYFYIEKENESYKRHVRVVKNRFVDRTSKDWVEELVGNVTFSDIVKITKLPEEVVVL